MVTDSVMVARFVGKLEPLLLGLALLPSCSCGTSSVEPIAPRDAADETRIQPREEVAAVTPTNEVRGQAQEENFIRLATLRRAFRSHDYLEARRLLEHPVEGSLSFSALLYAKARANLELGELDEFFPLVSELERTAPDYSPEIQKLKERALDKTDDATLAALLAQGRTDTLSQLALARALLAAGELRAALDVIEPELMRLNKQSTSTTTKSAALALRMAVRKALGDTNGEAQDLRALLVLAPLSAEVDGGLERYRLLTGQSLSLQEHLTRAEVFSSKGFSAAVEDEMAKAAPLGAHRVAFERALAWAVFRGRQNYERAALLFEQLAKSDREKSAEHLYYAAKSWARAHEDDKAIILYEQVARGRSSHSEHAAYQGAHLRFIMGNLDTAVAKFEAYLKRFGARGIHGKAATHTLGIARLANGQYQKAEKAFTQLYSQEKDPRQRTRLIELMGVAALGQNQIDLAERRFLEAIREQPLSLPALFAQTRLRAMNRPVPRALPPALATEPRSPLSIALPSKAAELSSMGLDREAEDALRAIEAPLGTQAGLRRGELLCNLYGQLDTAERRYQIAYSAATLAVLSREPNPSELWQWKCNYPEPYADEVQSSAHEWGVDPALIYGVMRQESAFRFRALSHAGANGLMQIIEPTARRIAEELNKELDKDALIAPNNNIRFGAYYLRRLLDAFGGNSALAVSAYNAGPFAVKRWLKHGQNLPLDIFVASIPYDETRDYVYRVLSNTARYTYLRTQNPEAFSIELAIEPGLPKQSIDY